MGKSLLIKMTGYFIAILNTEGDRFLRSKKCFLKKMTASVRPGTSLPWLTSCPIVFKRDANSRMLCPKPDEYLQGSKSGFQDKNESTGASS
jgi:hypothetical protein